MRRQILAAVAELAGIASLAAGFWLISPAVGLISGGAGLIAVGLSLDPPARRS